MADEKDYLNMSDDEFDEYGMLPDSSESDDDEEELLENSEEEDNGEEVQGQESEEEVEEGEGEDEEEDEAQAESDDESEEEDTEEPKAESDEDKMKRFYDVISSPIKANKKEYKIDNPEEALSLIQMGLNYNAKMAALKPARQVIKTLEQHDMLSPDKVSYAIDLLSGNKEAISKLLADNKIDPLELDTDEVLEYKSKVSLASEQLVDLEDVIEGIKESDYYGQTLETVQNWDTKSQSLIAKDPSLVSKLNAQMENGIYQQVSERIDKLKAMGNKDLAGLSDLEAYVAVGNYMAEEGSLVDPSAGNTSNNQTGRQVQPKAGKTQNPKTQAKKKAASLPKSKPSQKSSDMNPLAMSDDDFDKLMAKYI